MKKLFKALTFSILFLIMLGVLSYILRPYSGSASRKNYCGFYAEEENSLDVVFIGASSCFAFWEPMEFWNDYGVTSYNFAAGTYPVQFYKYSIDEVRKTQDPKLYVIDLRPFTVAEDGYYLETSVPNMDHDVPIRNVVDNVKYSWNRAKMIWECLPEEYDKVPYLFDIIKYHTEWPRLLDAQSLAFAANDAHDSLKGFKKVEAVKKVKFTDHSMVETRQPLSDRLDVILKDLLEYCKKEQLEVLFLVNAYCQKEEEKAVYNYISDVVAEYDYSFINTNDYYKEIGFDYTQDYYDNSHVNIFGADKYTDFVGAYLMGNYSFEDKRGQKEYETWDADYLIWEKEIAELKKNIQKKIDNRKKK